MSRFTAKNNYQKTQVLDLHNLNLRLGETPKEAAIRRLESFMFNFLDKKPVELTVIVGKGLGSKRFIEGKNPLRYYVEEYLIQLGFSPQEFSYNEGIIFIRPHLQ